VAIPKDYLSLSPQSAIAFAIDNGSNMNVWLRITRPVDPSNVLPVSLPSGSTKIAHIATVKITMPYILG
jgi:hypothetical protein